MDAISICVFSTHEVERPDKSLARTAAKDRNSACDRWPVRRSSRVAGRIDDGHGEARGGVHFKERFAFLRATGRMRDHRFLHWRICGGGGLRSEISSRRCWANVDSDAML